MVLLQALEQSDDYIIFGALLLIFLVYIGICVLVGRYSKKRGNSFWGFFLLSLFVNPLIGFIIAAIVGGETDKQREERIRQETKIRIDAENHYRQQLNQMPPPLE